MIFEKLSHTHINFGWEVWFSGVLRCMGLIIFMSRVMFHRGNCLSSVVEIRLIKCTYLILSMDQLCCYGNDSCGCGYQLSNQPFLQAKLRNAEHKVVYVDNKVSVAHWLKNPLTWYQGYSYLHRMHLGILWCERYLANSNSSFDSQCLSVS